MSVNDVAKKNGLDFLLYSYFGITIDDSAEKMIVAVINRAYRDAASHVLSVKDEYKDELKQDASTNIFDAITEEMQTLSFQKEEFDEFHRRLCDDLVQIYEDKNQHENIYKEDEGGNYRVFTYGIAQKWVNMTFKYMYLLNILFEENKSHEFIKKYGVMINDKANEFHIPIDSYMFKAIKKHLEIDFKRYNLPDAWSKIDNYDNYLKYQKQIRKEVRKSGIKKPIDWEFPAWIAQSKAEK